MNELDFSGKHVLVVGGSSGIGNGIAQAFRARGSRVHVCGTHRRPTTVEVGVEIVIRNRQNTLLRIGLIVSFQLGRGLKPQSRLAAPFLSEPKGRRWIGRTAKKLVPRRMVDRCQTDPFEHGVRLSILFAERVPGDSVVAQKLFQLHPWQCLS